MGRRPSTPGSIPHLRARRQKSGVIHYYYDHGGKPRRETPLGSDYGLAIKRWAELHNAGQEKVKEVITFRYVANQYRASVIPTKAPRTQRDNLKELVKLIEFFDDPPGPLDSITPQYVKAFLKWRGQTAKTRANREKALFSHIWNWAREEGYTSMANPCAGVKGFKEEGRDVYVHDDEFQAVWNAGDQTLRDAMDLAYLTGQRPSDVHAMDDRQVRDGAIEVHQGKTKAKVRIEVSGDLVALIARIQERKRSYAIYSTRLIVDEKGHAVTYRNLRTRFEAAREAAGVHFQFRDLRAKAGTDKADFAGDIRQAQKQLGHTSVVMTEHYVRKRRGEKVSPTR